MKIAVLIATYNRAETTLQCLENLHRSQLRHSTFIVYLVDAGSSDDTARRVRQGYPETVVSVIHGVYWNIGMLEAWKKSLESLEKYDGFLWLNDDVQLKAGALQEIIETFEQYGGNSIIVGHTKSPSTNEVTYGPLKNSGRSRINFQATISNSDKIVSMNGNCVLIPRAIQELIGLLSPRFQHSFGDIDYGLRATKAGIKIVPTKNSVSDLERNDSIYSKNVKQTPVDIIRLMQNPKGIPIIEWLYFTKTHAGVLWPINFVFRYLKMLW
jgi:GT2 family glycosyltransferase